MNHVKHNKILYLLIVLIVLLVGYLVIKYFNNYKEMDVIDNNDDVNKVANNIYEFNGYKFLVPDGLTYAEDNDTSLKIVSNAGWYAIVKLSSADDENIKSVDELYELNNGLNNSSGNKLYKETIDEVNVLIYERPQDKKTIYYFGTTWNSYYEIVVNYENENISSDYLSKIIDSLLSPVNILDILNIE